MIQKLKFGKTCARIFWEFEAVLVFTQGRCKPSNSHRFIDRCKAEMPQLPKPIVESEGV